MSNDHHGNDENNDESGDRGMMELHLGRIIDGKAIADAIRSEIALELLSSHPPGGDANVGGGGGGGGGGRPGLAVMLVGSRKDSATYVRMKQKACADAGMASYLEHYPDVDDDVTEDVLVDRIRRWNDDDDVHGILVQLPLPPSIDERRVLSSVDPEKDVDGLHPSNVARLFSTSTHDSLHRGDRLDWTDFSSVPFHVPCTPQGCIELLDRIGCAIEGRRAVVIGRSNLVGLPVAMLLVHRNATVTIVHSRTANVDGVVREADIVVAAAGRAGMVQPSWLKRGCVVIDVGINAIDDINEKRGYRLVGDVDYEGARKVAGYVTPVPGGVGPMTIAMLLRNTCNSWRRRGGGRAAGKRNADAVAGTAGAGGGGADAQGAGATE
jgi:5,10-methylene-tetrahydrofolate dehydrogenase/methenyl tetrahydrofolate cyclohydrolase